jgi:hypothetical protein
LKTGVEDSEVSVEEIIEDKIDIILEEYILPIFKALHEAYNTVP